MRGNSLIASVQYSDYLYDSFIGFNTNGVVGRTDVVTQHVTGESGNAGNKQISSLKHTRGAVTWYKPNWFRGNHELKAGLEYGAHKKVLGTEQQMVNYHLFLSNGAPYQFVAYNAPVEPSVYADMLASYVRDSWTIGRRLTLNLGLRFDSTGGILLGAVPRHRDCSLRRHLSRRMFLERGAQHLEQRGAAAARRVRPVGRRQDRDQGGYGRYDHMRQLEPDALRVAGNAIANAVYTWHDLNGNLDYDPGEVNLDRNGPDFVETVGRLSQGTSLPSPPPNSVVNPDERQPRYDEFSVSLERELIPNLAVRGTGVYTPHDERPSGPEQPATL